MYAESNSPAWQRLLLVACCLLFLGHVTHADPSGVKCVGWEQIDITWHGKDTKDAVYNGKEGNAFFFVIVKNAAGMFEVVQMSVSLVHGKSMQELACDLETNLQELQTLGYQFEIDKQENSITIHPVETGGPDFYPDTEGHPGYYPEGQDDVLDARVRKESHPIR